MYRRPRLPLDQVAIAMLVGVASGYFLFKQPLDEYWRAQGRREEGGPVGGGEKQGQGDADPSYTFLFRSQLAPASTRSRVMAFTQARRVLILAAFLAAMVAVAFAGDDDNNRGDSWKPKSFTSALVGANEIPKNNSEAARNAVGDKRGTVDMKLDIHKSNGEPVFVAYSVKT
ncbi:unnamed protein product [Closterium sp. NIES-64]|nr:unnamed protein product [Closterium sp. NIES-64]